MKMKYNKNLIMKMKKYKIISNKNILMSKILKRIQKNLNQRIKKFKTDWMEYKKRFKNQNKNYMRL